MAGRSRPLFRWLGITGLAAWALLYYRAYTQLAIPAFGPAEQAVAAARGLSLRYLLYLALGSAVYAAFVWWARRRGAARGRRRGPLTGAV